MIDVFFIVLIQNQFKAARCVYKPLFIFWQLPYFFSMYLTIGRYFLKRALDYMEIKKART